MLGNYFERLCVGQRWDVVKHSNEQSDTTSKNTHTHVVLHAGTKVK